MTEREREREEREGGRGKGGEREIDLIIKCRSWSIRAKKSSFRIHDVCTYVGLTAELEWATRRGGERERDSQMSRPLVPCQSLIKG